MEKTKKLLLELQSLVENEFSTKRNRIIIWIDVLLVLALVSYAYLTHFEVMLLPAIAGILLIALFIYLVGQNKKNKVGEELLNDAFDSLRRGDYKNTFETCFEAYEKTSNNKILSFLFDFVNFYRPDISKQSKIFKLELEKVKTENDKKIIDNLMQIIDAIENIKQLQRIKDESNHRIIELKQEKSSTDDIDMLQEFDAIIARFNSAIAKSSEKIEFYEHKIDELIKNKNRIIVSKKLKKAKEDLLRIEDQLWEGFLSEDKAYKQKIEKEQFIDATPKNVLRREDDLKIHSTIKKAQGE